MGGWWYLPTQPLSMPTSRPLTALLVDDEAYFRRFVGQVLHNRGCAKVAEAGNGCEALEILAAAAPDFVVMDINMPHMDGLEALRAIRATHKELPIIMLTSIADEMVVEKCVEEGATYFIRKDVPAEQLVLELGEWLEGLHEAREATA
jgi:CheY-like chemotaxis protein